jgi:hypothetical protein
MALAGVLRDSWSAISTKTAITTDDLDQAELIGDQLVSAVGSREEAPASVAEVSVQRQRNFTLFLNAYDEVRRAITFLRWNENDVERIAPSLYAGRGNSNTRKKTDDTPPTTGQPVAGAAPVAAPTAPSPAVSSASATHTALTPAASPVAPGLPGSSPFAVS